jgi:hypothetical protein
MAAYAGYIPVIQTPYLLQGMFSEEKFQMLLAAGVMNAEPIDGVINKGDKVNIPQAIQVDDFSSVDLTSTTAVTGTRATTNNALAPIVRHYTAMSFTEHDDIRTRENWRELFAASAGNKLAKDVILTMHNSLIGAIQTSGLNHLVTENGPITTQSIRRAKRLLSDQGHNVDSMLIHPDVWSDLFYDITTQYKFSGPMSGEWLANGEFESMFGIRNVIVSADIVAVGGGSSDSYHDQYYTWFFKRNDPNVEEGLGGPIYYGYQAEPRYAEFVDSRVPSTLFQPKWNTDYCLGVRGLAFNGPNNPAMTDLNAAANWALATNDTRNVGVVACFTEGAVY